jgi:biopolymer transport protein ExbD
MYRVPSRKKKRHTASKINLIPILDAVFIFIFFLLTSANFIKIFEISSDVPIISEKQPPKNKKKPLALTLKIYPQAITLSTGVPSIVRYKIGKINGKYDLKKLHTTLINIKQRNKKENTVILEPIANLDYEELVTVMDSIRMLDKTDPSFYSKDKDGVDKKEESLFSNIIFGNIQT